MLLAAFRSGWIAPSQFIWKHKLCIVKPLPKRHRCEPQFHDFHHLNAVSVSHFTCAYTQTRDLSRGLYQSSALLLTLKCTFTFASDSWSFDLLFCYLFECSVKTLGPFCWLSCLPSASNKSVTLYRFRYTVKTNFILLALSHVHLNLFVQISLRNQNYENVYRNFTKFGSRKQKSVVH